MTESQQQVTVRHRRVLTGVVVSDKMEKTVVVQVERKFQHPRYRKYVRERVRYKAHDERNLAKVGDKVNIVEVRPLSREKRWAIRAILEKATIV